MMDDTFDAKALALKPEHLERGRLAETGIAAAKRERRKREFAQITREQVERLAKAASLPPHRFPFPPTHRLEISGSPILLANDGLEQIGVHDSRNIAPWPTERGWVLSR